MPFWYNLAVPTLETVDSQQQPNVRLVRWQVDEGAVVHQGTVLAMIEVDSAMYEVLANGHGYLREKLFPDGAVVSLSSTLATVNADGENIPYNRPYSIARRINL
jgi:pyruvate/2-oxoglutarate dehydrogenase complex dihydrolipoamide acyltransferase (E2) component